MRFLGFIVGFAVLAALEFLLLSAMGVTPRGVGWVALPIVAGITLSRAAPSLVTKLTNGSAKRAFFRFSSAARLAIIGASLWGVSVPVYVFLFEPYGSYMASYDYSHMFKVMLFPMAIIAIGYFAYSRFVIGSSENFADDSLDVPQAEASYPDPHIVSPSEVDPIAVVSAKPQRASRVKLLQVVVLSFLACIALVPIGFLGGKPPFFFYVYIVGIGLWVGLTLVFLIRIGSRRLHDFDQPAWWLLLLLIPYINLVFVLALLLIPGNPRANRYGESPVG